MKGRWEHFTYSIGDVLTSYRCISLKVVYFT